MKKRQMYLRMITASLMRRRSRMLVALLSIAIGATILSGLVTIYYDVPRQMGAQFRNYGANMIFTASDEEMSLDDVHQSANMIPSDDLIGMTPYRYENIRIRERPIVVAGTDMESIKLTSPSSASVIIDQPSGNYVILLNLDSMEEDDFWMDFFSGESVDFCFEDISCMTAKNDPTAITMAQSFQSRLSEHQMTLRTEDATLMLSRADEGKFQVIVLSEEIAEHYHAQSVMMGKTAQNTVWIPLTNLDGIEEDET